MVFVAGVVCFFSLLFVCFFVWLVLVFSECTLKLDSRVQHEVSVVAVPGGIHHQWRSGVCVHVPCTTQACAFLQ